MGDYVVGDVYITLNDGKKQRITSCVILHQQIISLLFNNCGLGCGGVLTLEKHVVAGATRTADPFDFMSNWANFGRLLVEKASPSMTFAKLLF